MRRLASTAYNLLLSHFRVFSTCKSRDIPREFICSKRDQLPFPLCEHDSLYIFTPSHHLSSRKGMFVIPPPARLISLLQLRLPSTYTCDILFDSPCRYACTRLVSSPFVVSFTSSPLPRPQSSVFNLHSFFFDRFKDIYSPHSALYTHTSNAPVPICLLLPSPICGGSNEFDTAS